MSGINNYFSNNNIFNGTEIPTQGKFDVGDIIVNIGENAEEEPMWMCIEAGEPGVWKVVGKVEDIDLSGYQEKTDENLATESKDLVGAINELFQSANNGKQLIASAIGEPLSSEDTFSAMSNDINGLLSTFKTNMMNNGVMVESNDRFKQLIDKIATLADNEGKGVQFASGTVLPSEIKTGSFTYYSTNTSYNGTNMYYLTINDLKFTPSVILITGSHVYRSETRMTYGVFDIINNMPYYVICGGGNLNLADAKNLSGTIKGAGCYDMTVSNSMDFPLGFALNNSYPPTLNNFTWYAFGVGEEDTTLRDSLASILQEEGIIITEDDDMASLISKVDEEFTKDNNTINNLTNELAGKVTPAGTAVASNVLTGKTFINSTGSTLTGTMANNGTKTITPKASAQTLGTGYYDKITINGDSDLVAANIVSGKNIFGVAGSAIVAKKYTSSTTNCIAYMFAYNSNTIYYTCVADGVLNIKCVYQRTDISSSSIETTNMQTDTMYTFNVTAGEKINFKCRTSNSYSRIYIYANIS